MIDKQVSGLAEALADVFDGATVMIGGFGEAGSPIELVHALIDQGARGLTVVSNNTGSGEVGLAALIKARRVAKMVCSFPRSANSVVFPELYRNGEIRARAGAPGKRSPSASAPVAPACRRSTPRLPSAPPSPKARRCGASTDATTSWSVASSPTSRSSRGSRPTASATSSTTRRRGTSAR